MSAVVVPVSGGWDSALTWLFVSGYLRDGLSSWYDPDAVAVFVDPGREHPNNYRVLDFLDRVTGKPVVRLRGPTWEQALDAYGWFLPSPRARWCTRVFKIRPFESWVGQRSVRSCVGLRADEPLRVGYLGDRVEAVYPLREMGITYSDREWLAGRVGLPDSGLWSCDCCPFKPHFLWVRLIEEYPQSAEWAAWVEEEKERRGAGGFGWLRGYRVRDLIDNPALRAGIRRRWWARHDSASQLSFWDGDDVDMPCLVCQVK